MAFRIILILVVVLFFLFPSLWEGIKTIFGAFFIAALLCGIGGALGNWVVQGELLCWSAFKTGCIVGLCIAGAIIAIKVVVWLVRQIF